MLPVIAITGRPNVGKSTLFNALTGTRNALVGEEPGVTRDRQYGVARIGKRSFLVVDTGGLTGDREELARLTNAQTLRAVEEANVTLFLVDGREGLTALDQEIGHRLRTQTRQILLVVNKTEGLDTSVVTGDFYTMGLGNPWPIAAAHGRGLRPLLEEVARRCPPTAEEEWVQKAEGIKVAIVGRPNVGKSTLVNRMVGTERVIAHDSPGTTRDSIAIPCTHGNTTYTLIDTAGIRRRGRVSHKLEKFSIIKALQAIEAAHVVILLLDARAGVTDQDAHLLGLVLDAGRALVVAVNKWDGLDFEQRRQVQEDMERKLRFVAFAPRQFISALHGSGVGDLFTAVDTAWGSAFRQMATPLLTRILEDAVRSHSPPLAGGGHRIKLRYAHQGGQNPPVIVVHGNQTAAVPAAYHRYLIRVYRTALGLEGTPLRLEFRDSENPYKDRRNTLTPRQRRKRARLLQHAKTLG